MSLAISRLETLVVARLATSNARPSTTELAKALRRFAPKTLTDAEWIASVEQAARSVEDVPPGDPAPLVARIGKHTAKTWNQLADRVLPLVALGVAPDDKAGAKLKDRDAWTAAIAARVLGMWREGPPPSLAAVCDTYVWRALALPGKPKRCPPEVRAVFFQRELATDSGPPDRLLRLFVARELEEPRSELRVLRDALVRRWLLGRELGASPQPTAAAPAPTAAPPVAFASEVISAARSAREGLFGERKVFISSVWDGLRRNPGWSSLTLEEFKDRLVRAHRAGDVVLARADLVAAMNPELVAASETLADGASFHFIVREDAS